MMKALKFDFKYGAQMASSKLDDWQRSANGYRVTFTYDRRKVSFDYWQGPAITRDPIGNDVMSCLVSDATAGEQSFHDFCDDFGYDEDSRSAERTWKACQGTATQLRALFGADFAEAMAYDWEGQS